MTSRLTEECRPINAYCVMCLGRYFLVYHHTAAKAKGLAAEKALDAYWTDSKRIFVSLRCRRWSDLDTYGKPSIHELGEPGTRCDETGVWFEMPAPFKEKDK